MDDLDCMLYMRLSELKANQLARTASSLACMDQGFPSMNEWCDDNDQQQKKCQTRLELPKWFLARRVPCVPTPVYAKPGTNDELFQHAVALFQQPY